MKKKTYLAPDLRVHYLCATQMICASVTTTLTGSSDEDVTTGEKGFWESTNGGANTQGLGGTIEGGW